MSTPGRQSGSRAATLPSGRTSAARPGKSSSAVEPGLTCQRDPYAQPLCVQARVAEAGLLPPCEPAPPGGFVGAPPVQSGSGREQDQPGTGRGGGVERRVDPRFGADGYPEPHASVLEYGRFGPGGVGFLVLAKVPLTLHAGHLAGRGEHLGDVRLPARGALGDPKAHADAAVPGRLSQLGDGWVVQGYQAFRVGGWVRRSRQRHLREQRQLAACCDGVGHKLKVGREVPRDAALLAADRGQLTAHAPRRAPAAVERQAVAGGAG